MESRIVPLNSEKDGRRDVRAWIRTSKHTQKAVFVAAYSSHRYGQETYMNIALPLPLGQMTGVLRFENDTSKDDQHGLILTSLARENNKGDEGIYYVTKWFSMRLPLNEKFVVWIPDARSHLIKAYHEMWMFGLKFLSIDYTIEKKEG